MTRLGWVLPVLPSRTCPISKDRRTFSLLPAFKCSFPFPVAQYTPQGRGWKLVECHRRQRMEACLTRLGDACCFCGGRRRARTHLPVPACVVPYMMYVCVVAAAAAPKRLKAHTLIRIPRHAEGITPNNNRSYESIWPPSLRLVTFESCLLVTDSFNLQLLSVTSDCTTQNCQLCFKPTE